MPSKKEKLPLSVTHPELAKEAYGWDPSKYTSGSNKKLDWSCNSGHVWEAALASRTRKNKNGCPYCSNKRVLTGFNDLKTLFPEMASTAYGWDPSIIVAGSGKVLPWICERGHSWTARVVDRTTKNYGCPTCTGKITKAGFNDLFTTHQIVAEEANGWDPRTVTFGSNKKKEWICGNGHRWTATVSDRAHGTGCPVCSGQKTLSGFNDLQTTHPELAKESFEWDPTKVSRGTHKKLKWKCSFEHLFEATVHDRVSDSSGCPVCSNHQLLAGFNDLQTTHPELAKESFEWDPTKIVAGNQKKHTWKCRDGHIWEASPSSRSRLLSGCPVCVNKKVLKGFNDLSTTNPEISSEAFGWDAAEFVGGSGTIKEWKCKEGHQWKTRISHRVYSRSGCPSCASSGYDPNMSGYFYFLSHSDWEMFQIGITNLPDDRLSRHKRLGWELLELRGPMDGHLTQQWETAILRMLKAKGADLSNSKIAAKFDGYSEAWSKSTFDVKSIKELMRLTEEFETKIN